MPSKRKAAAADGGMDDDGTASGKRQKAAKKDGRKSNHGYNTQQKAAITQFMSFANTDRNTAVRLLKNHNWDAQTAVNAYFSGGGGNGASSSMKTALNKLFDKYREDAANEPDSVGAEGTMGYFGELEVDLDGLDSLAVSEIIQAPTLGEMSREGFVEGWTELRCDTLDQQRAYIQNLKKTLPSDREAFTKIYKHTFQLAKPASQKAVLLENAIGTWEILFTSPLSAVKWTSPNSPWIGWWTEFLTSAWKKSVNKDMWNETLKFAQLTLQDEAISFWNEESSWPSVIDEFVEWVKKEKRGGGSTEAMEE